MSEMDSWRDVVEIHGAIARIAQAMDSAPDVKDLIDLLTQDIEWSFGENLRTKAPASTLSGVDAIEHWATSRRLSKNQGPESGTKHVVTNEVVEFADEDTAQVRAYFCFYGMASETPVLNAVGTYDDEFRKVGGRWLLAKRLIRV